MANFLTLYMPRIMAIIATFAAAMKKNLSMLACLAALCSFHAAASETPVPHSVAVFAPALMQAISEYEGTLDPVIPADDFPEIERPRSTVPGRMHMPRRIIVNKRACSMRVENMLGDVLFAAPVCSSRNRGQKHFKDDCRTPEGTFPLYGVYRSSEWRYQGTGDKCYGPFFLSLKIPVYAGVGLHGTNSPGSVPGRSSHGCIRLHNEDIVVVKSLTTKDIRVTVLPDYAPGSDEEAADERAVKERQRARREAARAERESKAD